MMLRSRNEFPPGGWLFHQAETGWDAPSWLNFDATVSAIVSHRKSNPRFNLSTDVETVGNQLEQYTIARLRSMPGAASFLIEGGPSESAPASFQLPPRQKQSGVAGVAKFVKNTVAGAALYAEWFGKSPVIPQLADERAAVCVGCPHNLHASTWMERFSSVAAREITAILGTMKRQEMRTKHDDKLGVCVVCDCPLRAKVWAPMDLIQNHLLPEARLNLWERCWIRHGK